MRRTTWVRCALLALATWGWTALSAGEAAAQTTDDEAAVAEEAAETGESEPDGEGPPKDGFVHSHNLQIRINPLGLSVLSFYGYRAHLFDSDSMVLQNTYIDTGITTSLSPAYVFAGPYIEATPVAFIKLRTAFRRLIYFGTFGFVYDGFESRDAAWDQDALDAIDDEDLAESALGTQLELSGTLQLKFGPIVALYENRYSFYWMDSDVGDFYYEPYEDLLFEDNDAVWTMVGTLGYVIAPDEADWFLLVGGRYDRHHSRDTDFTKQQLGGLLLWGVPRSWISWGSPRVALIVENYLEHPMREGEMYIGSQISFTFGP